MMHAAGSIVATGSNATQNESFAFLPVTHTAPFGVAEQPGSAVERNAPITADQSVEPAVSAQSKVQDAGIRIDLSRIGEK